MRAIVISHLNNAAEVPPKEKGEDIPGQSHIG